MIERKNTAKERVPRKKKEKVVEELPPSGSIVAADEVVVSAADQTCINCRFLTTGQWTGPLCNNPESPNFRKRMPDHGTCEKWTPKESRRDVSSLGVLEEATDADGLYDPV